MRLISKGKFLLVFTLLAFISACKSSEESVGKVKKSKNNILLPEFNWQDFSKNTDTAELPDERPIYQASRKRINDVIDLKLDIKPNWSEARLYGVAELLIKPYFYETDSLWLDAKGMIINKVELLERGQPKPLSYTYDNKLISIGLGQKYNRNQTYIVRIDYVARPDELSENVPDINPNDKGMFFIRPDKFTYTKPLQIWTQGETEENSIWFPIIDAPNEKITHTINVTVEDKFQTLSNGILKKSVKNSDNTRTDTWVMDKPHAPYLVALIVGEYAIVKDKWRNIEVDYWVEKEYIDVAKTIFGHTPEMLEFFSNLLGYPYPWQKYHQVFVRDYTSGAMENTTAVIFGEFVQQTQRELLDDNNESIIAHELFHHWFGDLVTCESWANLPLNESFANYSEYLWFEHKYGKEEALYHWTKELEGYLNEGKFETLIRFNYVSPEEMFDAHSYNKGGIILNMLRNYIGDEAFFISLKNYLKQNEYKPTEIHQLRLAFEEVTGEDLNWFFNQWFFEVGHPYLDIAHFYDADLGIYNLTVTQIHTPSTGTLYKIPVDVDIYFSPKQKETKRIWIDRKTNTFKFPVDKKPLLVNFDAGKTLLCQKVELKSNEEWKFQYEYAANYIDRKEALENFDYEENPVLSFELLSLAIDDPHWSLREMAINYLTEVLDDNNAEFFVKKLRNLAENDRKSDVRVAAITALAALAEDLDQINYLLNLALSDSAYSVLQLGLEMQLQLDEVEAYEMMQKLEDDKTSMNLLMLSKLYTFLAIEAKEMFYLSNYTHLRSPNHQLEYTINFADYLTQQGLDKIQENLEFFEYVATTPPMWFVRYGGYIGLFKIMSACRQYRKMFEAELQKIDKKDSDTRLIIEMMLGQYENTADAIEDTIKRIKANEKSSKLLEYLGDF